MAYPRTNNRYTSAGGSTAAVVKIGEGAVLAVTCLNLSTEDRYLQFYDRNTLPVSGAKPILSVPVYKNNGYTELGKEILGADGLVFDQGICWSMSTVAGSYTSGLITEPIIYFLWV